MTGTISRDDILTFGKYKGWKVDDIAAENPGYLIWCIENIDWFKVSKEYERALRLDMAEEDRYDWSIDPYDLCD
jgi:hypothetical protein